MEKEKKLKKTVSQREILIIVEALLVDRKKEMKITIIKKTKVLTMDNEKKCFNLKSKGIKEMKIKKITLSKERYSH